ncbi:MAG: hypothetical protein M1829_005003 [Trizodia sp. TS-e1964]|nr:MAG: hypothetical protein M1829_005003 [Trizodia sp. TS-e1964]
MNQAQQYGDWHLSNGQAHTPPTATAAGIPHYNAQQSQQHQQQQQQQQQQQPAPIMHAGQSAYAAPPYPNTYGYSNTVPSPQPVSHPATAPPPQIPAQLLPLPVGAPNAAQQAPPPAAQPSSAGAGQYPPPNFDITGQVAPAGMKPRVTATLWEDEGSLCFQVEAKGVCVARREDVNKADTPRPDNHMINGTKLLNVAGMTRGRRDGILKSEKIRHVVKIGPMHLKGVWIPFERALDFANKEKITELLYPLFVHNIGALLYHPTNQHRTTAVMAAAERRRMDANQRSSQGPQAQTLHHHHSMHTPGGPHAPGPVPSGLAPQPRPNLERAHTFPTPPTSASSLLGMSGSEGYQWSGQNIGSVPGAQPLSIDTGLSNAARSLPSTPATTPPGTAITTMPPYPNGHSFDAGRQMYSAPPAAQPHYTQHTVAQQNMARFGAPGYLKNEMGPPSNRAPGAGPDDEHSGDGKEHNGILPNHDPGAHAPHEEEHVHQQEPEYAHDNTSAYNATRASYPYQAGPSVGSITGEHAQLSPEMTGSPAPDGTQPGSGRGTPRNSSGPGQWASQPSGYHTPPPRAQAPASNLYNIIDQRGAANAASAGDSYQPASGGITPMASAYPNGTSSNKRLREVDEEEDRHSRPSSRGADEMEGIKRRKTLLENSTLPNGQAYERDIRPLNRTRSVITQRRR